MSTERFWSLLVGACCVWSTATVGCGGPAEPAESPEPPPSLEDDDEPSGASAPASSAAVKEGIDAISAGDFEKAKSVLTDAVAKNGDDVQAVFYLGVALEGTGDGAGAMAQYEKALKLDPKLLEARVNLSAVILDSGEGARAMEVVEAGLADNPRHPGLLANKALAHAVLGDDAAARDAYAVAVKAAPDDETLRFSYAEALAATGDAGAARSQLAKLQSSASLEVLASSARLLGRLKDFAGCVKTLDKAIGKQQSAELLVQRGLCKHGQKDEQGALGDFEKSVAADAKFAAAHYYLGQHQKMLGDKKKARASLETAVRLAGDKDGVGKAAKAALKGL